MLEPQRRATGAPDHLTLATALCLGLLVVSNVTTNRLLPGSLYIFWNLSMAALLVLVATRIGGCTMDILGLARRRVPSGLAWGGLALGVVAGGMAVAAVLPWTRGLFEDRRVEAASVGTMLFQVFVRIPLGTVVMEEIAFRGVLLGLFLRRTTVVRAVAASSLLFGLWHVLPSWNVSSVNPTLASVFGDGALGQAVAVLGSVVGTGLAGVVFCALRLRSGSVVAPMLLHVATNSAGYLTAWIVWQLT